MKKFIIKTFVIISVFFILFALIIEGVFHFLPSHTYHIFNQDWLKIKNRVDSSKSKIGADTLYVGDSVAGQFLPFNKKDRLTSNGSILPIGNYFLIKNAIEKNENIKTVIYLSVPNVIGHPISRERTHGYVVKPFFSFENKREIMESKNVSRVLSRNLLLPLCQFNFFKVLKINDFDYSDEMPESSFSLSDTSIEWLKKIKGLCEASGVKFILASPPVPKSKKLKSSNWKSIKEQVSETDLEELFNIYFKTVIYIDDEHLRDNVHWKNKYVKKHKIEILDKILMAVKK